MTTGKKESLFASLGKIAFYGSIGVFLVVLGAEKMQAQNNPVPAGPAAPHNTAVMQSSPSAGTSAPAPVSSIGPAVQPQQFTLQVTAADLDTLGRGLDKLPYGEVNTLIEKLKVQLTRQQTPAGAK